MLDPPSYPAIPGEAAPPRLRRSIFAAIAAHMGSDGVMHMTLFQLKALLARRGDVGADNLTDDERDVMRVLWELAEAGTPVVTYAELAEEMGFEPDQVEEVKPHVYVLQLFGWLRVPPDPRLPIQIIRRPDMSHLDGEDEP